MSLQLTAIMKDFDPKPFTLPDFVEERDLNLKTESKVEQVTRLASEQIRMIRKRNDKRIKEINRQHGKELERAKAESFNAGKEQGLAESRERVEEAIKQLENISKKVENSDKDFLRNAEKYVVELSIASARRILGREIETDRELVIHTIRETLLKVADKVKISIHVNPGDMEIIDIYRKELQQVDRDFPELEFVPDELIDKGGCIIETRTGAIDGRIESQIEEIERSFFQET